MGFGSDYVSSNYLCIILHIKEQKKQYFSFINNAYAVEGVKYISLGIGALIIAIIATIYTLYS